MKKYFLLIISLVTLFNFSCTTKGEITPLEIKQAEAYRELGEAHLQTKNYTKALIKLLDAEKITPDDPIIHNDLGLVYMQKNRIDLAIEHFTKAVKLNPDYAVAKNNLGSAWCETGQWDKAIEILQELTGDLLYATPHYPLSNIGRAYYKKKNYTLAEQFYNSSLNKLVGKIYAVNENWNNAVNTFQKVISLAPESSYAKKAQQELLKINRGEL
ncbi:MAG: hypothetical protein B6I31_02050 [Desulfobacteraceae bacterium 4572_19]|nr:MAG: hypothetical protein B6I31_02050 [Desulfobacteraceae bacterium 4572_19]